MKRWSFGCYFWRDDKNQREHVVGGFFLTRGPIFFGILLYYFRYGMFSSVFFWCSSQQIKILCSTMITYKKEYIFFKSMKKKYHTYI